MMACSKLLVTKIKYSKSLQSQRTDGEIKSDLIFVQIFVNMCLKMKLNRPSTHHSLKLTTGE